MLNCSVNWLKTRNSPAAGGLRQASSTQAHGVADVEEAARLAALAVHAERLADGRLRAEAVEHRPPDAVVVEAGGEVAVQRGLGRCWRRTRRPG